MVPAPGSHLFRVLWTGAPRLLVSINAFCNIALQQFQRNCPRVDFCSNLHALCHRCNRLSSWLWSFGGKIRDNSLAGRRRRQCAPGRLIPVGFDPRKRSNGFGQ